MRAKVILFISMLFCIFTANAQKQYIWKPKDFIPSKHPNVLNRDTVYVSFSDNRGIPSNSKIKCSSEELIDALKSRLILAYPNAVFIQNSNYNNDKDGFLNLKIGIQKYCATFSPGIWTGWTTFDVSMFFRFNGNDMGHTKSCSYYSSAENMLGYMTAKKCLNEAYVSAFEDMCGFINSETNTINAKINQIRSIQVGPTKTNLASTGGREQLVEPSILSKIVKSNSKQELSPKEIYKKYNNAVFLIYTSDGDQIAQGSGFVVSSDGIAVSNYHVFKGTYKGLEVIKLPNGETHKIKEVYGFSEKFDYIVFQLDGSSFDYIPVHIGDIEIGDEVYAIGSPRGLVNTISNGLISQRHNDFIYQISVPIDHGSSGGALINKCGEAIGITSGGIDSSTANLNFAYDIKAFFSTPY